MPLRAHYEPLCPYGHTTSLYAVAGTLRTGGVRGSSCQLSVVSFQFSVLSCRLSVGGWRGLLGEPGSDAGFEVGQVVLDGGPDDIVVDGEVAVDE